MMSASARNRSPFTSTQWQELEEQAIIFKYMISGIPIPPHLLYGIKRSLDFSIPSGLFPHSPIGWGCFEMGIHGRKVDPEPGRCRRTDGKKWRCSKEAYPDSKYCERHMHRGKNRSRKPVEVTSTATTTTNLSPPNRNLTINTSPSSVSSGINPHHHPYNHESTLYPFLHSHSSSSKPPVSGLFFQDNTTPQLFLNSRSYSKGDKDYSCFHGAREGVDERAFFRPEASGTDRILNNDSYQRYLTMDSYKDFNSPELVKTEKETETQKPMHQFFGEWPPKNTDSWLDLASDSRVQTGD